MPGKTDHLRADVAIVGAGPAGMMAAIAAAELGRRVIVCEQLDRPGVKLLATGGGRCNLTNTCTVEMFMARFGRRGRFIQPALSALGSSALREFFSRLGVPTACPDGFHVYPASNRAVSVQAALWRRCRALPVRVLLRTRVTGLRLESGRLVGLDATTATVAAERVILAAGGASYPELGGTGGGYPLAAQAGHEIVQPTPALVPLVARERWPRTCAGISLPAVRVRIDLPGQARAGVAGDLLFTFKGLSGPAILDISGDVADRLSRRGAVPIQLDLSPEVAGSQWLARLDRWAQEHGARAVAALLADHFPRRLAQMLCILARIDPDIRAAELPAAGRRTLAGLLKALPLTVIATEGFERAMVTRGGVSLKQVDPRILQSRLLAGLFLAGELLDLDGPSGGYNLQWAFASGHLAGIAAARPPEDGS